MGAKATNIKTALDKPSNKIMYGRTAFSILLSLFFMKRRPMVATAIGLPAIFGLVNYLKGNKGAGAQRRSPAF